MKLIKPILTAAAGIVLFLFVLILEFRDAHGYLYRLFDNEAYLKFNLLRLTMVWLSGLLLALAALSTQEETNEEPILHRSQFKWGLFTSSLGVGFCLILAFNPAQFSHLVQEDGIIENLSAILFFVSWILCFAAAYKDFKRGSELLRALLLFAFGGLFWLIAMEEVSWFQRALDIETPAIMASNLQGEMNLHNFSTDTSESVYYFGSFVFLIILPAFRRMAGHLPFVKNTISVFPTLATLCAAAIFTAYNGNEWGLIFTQFTFFFTFSYLVLKVVTVKGISQKLNYTFLLLCLGLTQFLFLANTGDQIRTWDISEYKELFIPIAFFVYALGQASISFGDHSKKQP